MTFPHEQGLGFTDFFVHYRLRKKLSTYISNVANNLHRFLVKIVSFSISHDV